MTFDETTMRAHSIAANAAQEMRDALGRGDRRPTDHDLDLQFQAAKIFMQMESDPAPSVGVLRPSSARAPQTAGQRLSERIAERLAGKLDEDALLADIHSHATAYRPAAPTTQDDT